MGFWSKTETKNIEETHYDLMYGEDALKLVKMGNKKVPFLHREYIGGMLKYYFKGYSLKDSIRINLAKNLTSKWVTPKLMKKAPFIKKFFTQNVSYNSDHLLLDKLNASLINGVKLDRFGFNKYNTNELLKNLTYLHYYYTYHFYINNTTTANLSRDLQIASKDFSNVWTPLSNSGNSVLNIWMTDNAVTGGLELNEVVSLLPITNTDDVNELCVIKGSFPNATPLLDISSDNPIDNVPEENKQYVVDNLIATSEYVIFNSELGREMLEAFTSKDNAYLDITGNNTFENTQGYIPWFVMIDDPIAEIKKMSEIAANTDILDQGKFSPNIVNVTLNYEENKVTWIIEYYRVYLINGYVRIPNDKSNNIPIQSTFECTLDRFYEVFPKLDSIEFTNDNNPLLDRVTYKDEHTIVPRKYFNHIGDMLSGTLAMYFLTKRIALLSTNKKLVEQPIYNEKTKYSCFCYPLYNWNLNKNLTIDDITQKIYYQDLDTYRDQVTNTIVDRIIGDSIEMDVYIDFIIGDIHFHYREKITDAVKGLFKHSFYDAIASTQSLGFSKESVCSHSSTNQVEMYLDIKEEEYDSYLENSDVPFILDSHTNIEEVDNVFNIRINPNANIATNHFIKIGNHIAYKETDIPMEMLIGKETPKYIKMRKSFEFNAYLSTIKNFIEQCNVEFTINYNEIALPIYIPGTEVGVIGSRTLQFCPVFPIKWSTTGGRSYDYGWNPYQSTTYRSGTRGRSWDNRGGNHLFLGKNPKEGVMNEGKLHEPPKYFEPSSTLKIKDRKSDAFWINKHCEECGWLPEIIYRKTYKRNKKFKDMNSGSFLFMNPYLGGTTGRLNGNSASAITHYDLYLSLELGWIFKQDLGYHKMKPIQNFVRYVIEFFANKSNSGESFNPVRGVSISYHNVSPAYEKRHSTYTWNAFEYSITHHKYNQIGDHTAVYITLSTAVEKSEELRRLNSSGGVTDVAMNYGSQKDVDRAKAELKNSGILPPLFTGGSIFSSKLSDKILNSQVFNYALGPLGKKQDIGTIVLVLDEYKNGTLTRKCVTAGVCCSNANILWNGDYIPSNNINKQGYQIKGLVVGYSGIAVNSRLMPYEIWRRCPAIARNYIYPGLVTSFYRVRVKYQIKKSTFLGSIIKFVVVVGLVAFAFMTGGLTVGLLTIGLIAVGAVVVPGIRNFLLDSLMWMNTVFGQIILIIVTIAILYLTGGQGGPAVWALWLIVTALVLVAISVIVHIFVGTKIKSIQQQIEENQKEVERLQDETQKLSDESWELLLDVHRRLNYDQFEEIDYKFENGFGDALYNIYDHLYDLPDTDLIDRLF